MLATLAMTIGAHPARADLPLGQATVQAATASSLDLQVACGRQAVAVRVSSPAGGVFRVQVAPTAEALEPAVGSITTAAEAEAVVIKSGSASLRLNTGQFSLDLLGADGTPLTATAAAGPPLTYLGDEVGPGGLRLALRTHAIEHFYGLGEKFNALDQRGQRVTMWIRDAFAAKGDETYVCVPFYVSSAGYALWANTTAAAVFDMAAEAGDQVRIEVPEERLDLYLFAMGGLDALKAYTALTGRSPQPPDWALLPWIARTSYPADAKLTAQEQVLDTVRRFRERNIPCGAIVLDGWRTRSLHEFGPDRFPDPKAMLAELRAQGVHCLLWLTPLIHPRDPLYNEARDKGYLVTEERGRVAGMTGRFSRWAIVDLTNPEAVAWWQGLFRPLVKLGVSGFRTEEVEAIRPYMQFSDGRGGGLVHNVFPNLFNAAMWDLLQQEGSGVLLCRSGGAGVQRYPVLRAGDQAADHDDMRAAIRAGLSAGMSGIPLWRSDIGGSWGQPSKELYVRWAQWAAFSPAMGYQGDLERAPWSFDDETVAIYRRFATIRANLLPYLVSLARQAGETGAPLMRPLALEFPDDPTAATVDDQFMFGPNILVAPVCDPGATHRLVYLPAGSWLSLWDDSLYTGSRVVDAQVDLDTIPVYVRSGAIVPASLPAGRRLGDELRDAPQLTILVYPAAPGRFSLWDGGTATAVTCTPTQRDVRLDLGQTARPVQLRVWTSQPKVVTVDGQRLEPGRPEAGMLWTYDQLSQRLILSLPGRQAAEIVLQGTHQPTTITDLQFPAEVCSTERRVVIKCDVNYLRGPARPVLEWDHAGRVGQPVAGVHQLGERWYFRLPLPGAVVRRDWVAFRILSDTDATQPRAITSRRRITLLPPVEGSVSLAPGPTVGPSPTDLRVRLRRNCPGEVIGLLTISPPANTKVSPTTRRSYRITAAQPQVEYAFRLAFPPDLPVGEQTVGAVATWRNLTLAPLAAQINKPPTFAIIGPFDNELGRGFAATYPPERQRDLRARVRGKGGEVGWQVYPAAAFQADGRLDLGKAYAGETWACAYALAYVESDADRDAEIRVGSDDTVTIWLNDKPILARDVYRSAAPDEDVVPVRLRKGQNTILLKVCQGPGDWLLYFRLTGPNGSNSSGLRDLGPRTFAGLPTAKVAPPSPQP